MKSWGREKGRGKNQEHGGGWQGTAGVARSTCRRRGVRIQKDVISYQIFRAHYHKRYLQSSKHSSAQEAWH